MTVVFFIVENGNELVFNGVQNQMTRSRFFLRFEQDKGQPVGDQ